MKFLMVNQTGNAILSHTDRPFIPTPIRCSISAPKDPPGNIYAILLRKIYANLRYLADDREACYRCCQTTMANNREKRRKNSTFNIKSQVDH